jgi:cytochrome c peroxidase
VHAENADLGRFEITQTTGDKASFKTPTLREIARTAPYMHDGSLATLEDVVNYYDKGGTANPQLDEEIFVLKLSDQEKSDLVSFLREGLSSPDYPQIEPPPLPE